MSAGLSERSVVATARGRSLALASASEPFRTVRGALQEPFWPEGLGINRGMHNALDAVWAASQWAEARATEEGAAELVRRRQMLYTAKTLQMHGKNRQMLLGCARRALLPQRALLPRRSDGWASALFHTRYSASNQRTDAPKPAKAYSPDPATRYHTVE